MLLFLLFLLCKSSTSVDFSLIYKDVSYEPKSWSLVSIFHPEMNIDSFNLALPDCSSEYWFTTFAPNEKPILFIKNTESVYSSLTAYDVSGFSIDNSHIDINNYNSNYVNLMKESSYNDYFSIVYRIYYNDNGTGVFDSINKHQLPTIYSNHILYKNNDKEYSIENTKKYVTPAKIILEEIKTNVSTSEYNKQFKYPSVDLTVGLFPNPDAIYIIAFPERNTLFNISLIGKIPKNMPNKKSYKYYVDLMIADYDTTETINTVSIDYWCEKPCTNYKINLSNGFPSFIYIDRNISQVAIIIRSLYNSMSLESQTEIKKLKKLNGTNIQKEQLDLGIPVINYYDSTTIAQ